VGDRTLVDALQPAADALARGDGIVGAAERAREGADATASMRTARFGRSSHVSADHLLGVVDPGASAVAAAIEAYAAVWKEVASSTA
jgi:dihydroxyacetone kinase